MMKEKKLSKTDELIYKLYTKCKDTNRMDYMIEIDSILENRNGIRLTIEEPIIEWTIQGKNKKLNKKVLLISRDGDIKVESEKRIDLRENNIQDFINRTSYKLEQCTDNLIRMTKEEASITYKLNGHSIEKEKTITPSIIYLNNQGQILDYIALEKKSVDKPKTYTK